MFRKKTLIMICLAVAVAIPAFHSDCSAEEHKHTADEEKAGPKKPVYYCPMHPTYRSDKPGNCPICNMKLVLMKGTGPSKAVSHEEHARMTGEAHVPSHAVVELAPEQKRLLGVRTAEAVKGPLKRSLPVLAQAAYDRELYDAQIEYLREYRVAQGTLRSRELTFRNLVDSKWEAPRIDIARSALLRAGMDEESMAAMVEKAKADETLLYVSPFGDIWVYLEPFESEAAGIRKGDRVVLKTHGAESRTYESEVHSIGSSIDPETRRVRVLTRVKNDGFLKPGMYLHAVIESDAGEGIAVPASAVVHAGERKVVFVEKEEGVFEPREVVLGAKAGDLYEVRSGLAEGERVSVEGNFMLDSESRLRAAFEGAS